MSSGLSARQIRGRLRHPVIDTDGHWLEFGPVVRDRLRAIGGDLAVRGYSLFGGLTEQNLAMTAAARLEQRVAQAPWWTHPTRNTRDRATVMMPRLLHERLEEFGFDFSVLYPSAGLNMLSIPDAEMRRATCRAFNIFTAEYFGPYSDRLTPAAVIPMYHPDEAIAALEHAVRQLGFKVVCMNSLIPRQMAASGSVPGAKGSFPDLRATSAGGAWRDVLGLDSAYDYDPVWTKCVELGVSPTFHTGSRGVGARISPTNFCYNHIGHFAAASEAVCKALFIGGVTRRFPGLNIGFLEGGVGWACQLLGDITGHWSKRNARALTDVDPNRLDRAMLLGLARQYGSETFLAGLQTPGAEHDTVTTVGGSTLAGGNANLDDFHACGIEKETDIRDLFVDNFYFGCEADDPMNALAFNERYCPFGSRIRALFGSDIGHFDVSDMAGVLPEAYEMVEHELLDEDAFRDFLFGNPISFYCRGNPNFFKGTAVESEVGAWLQAHSANQQRK